jgi:hypothetical protein
MPPQDELALRPETALERAVEDTLREREAREFDPSERAEFWRTVFRSEEQALEEDWLLCLHCSWRLVRELARLKRMFRDDAETLGAATRMTPSPWQTPTGVFTVDDRGTLDPLVMQLLTLLPPLLPAAGEPDPLPGWLKVMGELGDRLGLYQSNDTLAALRILLDPRRARAAWPTPRQLIDYDEVQIGRALTLLLEHGEPGFMAQLQGAGYRSPERLLLLSLARRRSLELAGKDSEVDRATMILRLKSLAARARESGRIHAELSAERVLAAVQGLAQVEAAGEEVRDMAGHVRALPPPTVRRPSLPAPAQEDEGEET